MYGIGEGRDGESTRCRDIGACGRSMVATRARWRVDSSLICGSVVPIWIGIEAKELLGVKAGEWDELGSESCEGAGDGKPNLEEVSVGGGIVIMLGVVGAGPGVDRVDVEAKPPVGSPCAARAFITASQPRSKVCIRALSSSFSRSF